jgi:DNA-binding transcriptional LysR family regulator
LSVSQSAVSQRLQALEDQLGQRVLVRERPLRLTAAGTVRLRYARQMQAMHGNLERDLGAVSPSAGHVAIAVNADSLATRVLPALDPLVQAQGALARGELVALPPLVGIDVALYWHLGTDRPGGGAQVLDRIGAALAAGAPG